MKSLKGKPKGWLVTAVLSAAMVAYALFVFLPKQKATNEVRAQILERQQFILQSNTLTVASKQASDDLNEVSRFNEQWRTAAPTPHKLAPIVRRISTAAEEAHVDIIRLTPQQAENLDTIARVPVVIESRGTFADLFDFVRRLEGLSAAVWLEGVHFTAGASPENVDSQINCELTLAIFADNRGNSG